MQPGCGVAPLTMLTSDPALQLPVKTGLGAVNVLVRV